MVDMKEVVGLGFNTQQLIALRKLLKEAGVDYRFATLKNYKLVKRGKNDKVL